jgi:hypothetical protein
MAVQKTLFIVYWSEKHHFLISDLAGWYKKCGRLPRQVH